MVTKGKNNQKYSDLERELGDKRKQLPYPTLKNTVLEAVVIGHRTLAEEEQHLVLTEALGLGKKAEIELKGFYSEIIFPLGQRLRGTSSVVIDFTAVVHLEPTEAETNYAKSQLAPMLISSIEGYQLESGPNIKAVILYPILVSVLNSWRNHDSEFTDRIIAKIKENETDTTLKTLIEQLDVPVTPTQLKRN